MSPRTLLASGAIALTIAGIGYASKPAEIAPPRCAPVTQNVVRCFIPTEGRTAVAYLEAFEDGSVTPWTLDPDSRRWERNTSISQNPENATYWTGSLPRFLGR